MKFIISSLALLTFLSTLALADSPKEKVNEVGYPWNAPEEINTDTGDLSTEEVYDRAKDKMGTEHNVEEATDMTGQLDTH